MVWAALPARAHSATPTSFKTPQGLDDRARWVMGVLCTFVVLLLYTSHSSLFTGQGQVTEEAFTSFAL